MMGGVGIGGCQVSAVGGEEFERKSASATVEFDTIDGNGEGAIRVMNYCTHHHTDRAISLSGKLSAGSKDMTSVILRTRCADKLRQCYVCAHTCDCPYVSVQV